MLAACAAPETGVTPQAGAPVATVETAIPAPPSTPAPPPPPPPTVAPEPEVVAPPAFEVIADRHGGTVLDRDFPDPFVLAEGDTWFAYATNAHGMNVPVFEPGAELVDALPELGAWARPGVHRVWAPAVAKTGDGQYALFYSAEERSTGLMAVGVAKSDDPRGPFVDTGGPLVSVGANGATAAGGAIDAATFTEDGVVHLVWKNDGNSGGGATNIWMQRLAPDGRALEGDPVALLGEPGHEAWEVASYTAPRPLIEGPTLTKHGDTYYLFYSANDWHSEHYGINYATSDDLRGPFIRAPGPWLRSHGDRAGPGGQEIFGTEDGRTWMAFHAWHPDRPGYDVGGARRLVVAPLEFTAEGPKLG
ncbi:MAG: glycoside hydrolase family 43 protein [Deltaproteobacteria bacterium]